MNTLLEVSRRTTGDINDNVTPEFKKAEMDAIMRGAAFSQIYLVVPSGILWTNLNW